MLSRSPRALLLWGAAVVVAVATGVIVASDLATLHRRARTLGPERDALVARRDLPTGSIIDDADVRVRRVHSTQLPPDVLGVPDQAIGRVVAVPLLHDGFVVARNLAPRRRSGLDGVLPPGSRAMRVVVSDALRPRRGAGVDVLATFPGGDAPAEGESGTPAGDATVVAEGVLVLDVDDARTNEGAAGVGVTLLLKPRQARALAFAATHGVVTIALVPPEDAHSP